MNIENRDAYRNLIFKAVVVNTDINQDPLGEYRVQIFIPMYQYAYINSYEDYMNSGDKANHPDKGKYPWAKSLVKDLKEGNIVYGSNIENSDEDYLILGMDAYNPKNNPVDGSGALYNIDGSGLVDLAMPIIMHNEVGLAINAWPDGISESQLSNINCNDNGALSIGLIQWHGNRAFNEPLLAIKEKDSNWRSYWSSNTSSTFYKDLEAGGQSSKYGSWILQTGSADYNSIKAMLQSSYSKEAQIELAKNAAGTSISKLQESYNVTNPAIIIYCADIMNQYGDGVNSTVRGCLDKAGECSKESDIMAGLDSYYSYWKGRTSNYSSRRSTTYEYIKALNEQGKLNVGGLTEMGAAGAASAAGFIFPVEGCSSANINNKSYPSYSGHTGVDVNIGVSGKNVLAVADGTVIVSKACKNANGAYTSYGETVAIDHHNGYCTAYAHMVANSRRVNVGDEVKQGQILGLVDSTGNSTGDHLHFEVRVGANQTTNGNAINPLPFLP